MTCHRTQAAGKGTVLPLINWAGKPVANLTLSLQFDIAFTTARRGSGLQLGRRTDPTTGRAVFTLDLDVADAVVLR